VTRQVPNMKLWCTAKWLRLGHFLYVMGWGETDVSPLRTPATRASVLPASDDTCVRSICGMAAETEVQAYLVLLHFADIAFFYKLKFRGNPASNKSISAIFPITCALFVSLCHILVILAIFQTVHYYYICYGDV
jgi:hypothetical protein